MKKVLVGLILLAALFAFAAEATFSIGNKFVFTGSTTFVLLVNDKGIDISGTHLLDAAVTIGLTPTSVTAAGATFSLTYSFPTAGTSIGVNFTLTRIAFTTPYFNATWFVGRPNLSPYFTGRNADDSGWQAAYGAQFTDYLLVTVPNFIKDLELYYVDKSTEGTKHYFSDMFLVRYKLDPFTIVAGIYNTGNPATTTAALTDTQNHEFGAHVEGTLDLGFYKPTIRVFGGMVDTANRLEMKTAYEFQLTGAYNPINELTITPTIRVTENLALLDYKSDSLTDAKFVQANIKYSQAFGPITPTISVTPKYDFATATPTTTVKLDEATLGIKVDPVTAKITVTNADLLDQSKKFTLYTEATLKVDPFSVTAKAFWPDLTAPATYSYIELRSQATFSLVQKNDLVINADYAMVDSGAKQGYFLRARWFLVPTTTFICARVATVVDDNANGLYESGEFRAEPTWWLRLVYSARF